MHGMPSKPQAAFFAQLRHGTAMRFAFDGAPNWVVIAASALTGASVGTAPRPAVGSINPTAKTRKSNRRPIVPLF
jgi:hypothetical protein